MPADAERYAAELVACMPAKLQAAARLGAGATWLLTGTFGGATRVQLYVDGFGPVEATRFECQPYRHVERLRDACVVRVGWKVVDMRVHLAKLDMNWARNGDK